MTIDENDTDPRWDVQYSRPEGSKSLLTMKASLLKDITADQIENLVKKLTGTKDDPAKAMDENGLAEYPKSYVVKALLPFIVWRDNDGWVPSDAQSKLSNQEQPNK